ncbi:hypothetical protein [Alicyclobacillus ferrooxydans]|uniref:Uncharacterized protein n=1 Tax=Alicyclobacillus ferrooxydans TaxID=471514 RepID=A0A0N8PPX0_9BACL|nr:hypothetical protein [Alicyclobacillus ferrooxydans]KPV45501.1 hypothetical protein AN477_00635 [Alicyclobacillus ferrooxydans]
MFPSDERFGNSELIEHLKSLKLDKMNSTTDELVLSALRGQRIKIHKSIRTSRWFGGAVASVAGLCIAAGAVFVVQGRLPGHQGSTTGAGGQQTSATLRPSSVTHQSLSGAIPTTTYTYTGSEAFQAIKSLVSFKVKEPAVPKGFPMYRLQVVNTVPDSGGQASQQSVSFVSLTVPGKTNQLDSQNPEAVLRTHEWQQYAVSEYSSNMIDSTHYTSVPYLKTVPYEGIQVKVYSNKNHYTSTYLFAFDGHLTSVNFSAANATLGRNPLTDENAWKIIDSLIKGDSYLN